MPHMRGESAQSHSFREREFNKPTKHVAPEKLLADLLKRLAKRAMSDVTECPPDTIPAHLARIDDLREVIGHAMRHGLVEPAENRPSGNALQYAYTLSDYCACLDITRKTHRGPSFLNSRDEQLSEINRKLDMLAGLFNRSNVLAEILDESEGGAE